MKYLSNFITIVILLIPCIIMSIAASKNIIILGFISIIMMFVYIFCVPLTKSKENFWMLFLSSITLLPLNIKILIVLYPNVNYFFDSAFSSVLTLILLFFIMYNTEEIILGIITRVFKPNQEEIDFYKFF